MIRIQNNFSTFTALKDTAFLYGTLKRSTQKDAGECSLFIKFLGEVGLWLRNIQLDFGTDPHLDIGSIFHFSITERQNVFGIKYKLKELQMNVYDMFWRVGLRMMNSVGGGLDSVSAF